MVDWHYPRRELAVKILTSMTSNLYDRITIFAPRKSGKTEFVKRDVTPMARDQDILVVYVDFWRDKASPARAFANAVKSARDDQEGLFSRALSGKKLKAALKLAGTELSIESAGSPSSNEHSLVESAFEELESTKKRVLLLLDEVQHLATPGFEDFTASLRSFMTARSDNKIKGIFTGSSQEGLAQLFKRTNAPFYHASETIPFPPLDQEFVKYELTIFSKVTGGKKLNERNALDVFRQLQFGPGRFTGLLKKMAVDAIYDVSDGFERYESDILSTEEAEVMEELSKLKPIDSLLMSLIARGKLTDGLYSDSAMRLIFEKTNAKPTIAKIQNAVNRLRKKELLYSPEHGVWKIQDPYVESLLKKQRI